MSHARPCGRTRRRRAGFASAGALAVMLVVALLAAWLGSRHGEGQAHSRRDAARTQVQDIAQALHAYRADTGSYPSTEQGLIALWFHPRDEADWRGPYLARPALRDPWGRPFVYRCPGTDGTDFDLLSEGMDGRTDAEPIGDDIAYRPPSDALTVQAAAGASAD